MELSNPSRRRRVTPREPGVVDEAPLAVGSAGFAVVDVVVVTGLVCLEWSRDDEAEEEEAEATTSPPPPPPPPGPRLLFDNAEKERFRLTPDRTPDRTAALMECMVDREGPGDSPKQ